MHIKYLDSYQNIKTSVLGTATEKGNAYHNARALKNRVASVQESHQKSTIRDLISDSQKTTGKENLQEVNHGTHNKLDGQDDVIEKYLESHRFTEQHKVADPSEKMMGRLSSSFIPEPTSKLTLPGLERVSVPDNLPKETKTVSDQGNHVAPFVIKSNRVSVREATPSDLKDFVVGLVDEVARKFSLDSDLGLAIIETESSFNPQAISRDGYASKGLFQLLDSTGKELLAKSELSRTYDPYDPSLNIELGMRHLHRLMKLFESNTKLTNTISTYGASDTSSKEKLAIAAFNAGEGRVAQAQKQAKRQGEDPGYFASVKPFLPTTTQNYVDKVLSSRKRHSGIG
jgi:hypothetical protein